MEAARGESDGMSVGVWLPAIAKQLSLSRRFLLFSRPRLSSLKQGSLCRAGVRRSLARAGKTQVATGALLSPVADAILFSHASSVQVLSYSQSYAHGYTSHEIYRGEDPIRSLGDRILCRT